MSNRYAVYHDEESRTTVVSRQNEVFPEGSLRPYYAGADKISLKHRGSGENVLGPLHFQRFERKDGTGFATGSDCFQYLETELDKRHENTTTCWDGSDW